MALPFLNCSWANGLGKDYSYNYRKRLERNFNGWIKKQLWSSREKFKLNWHLVRTKECTWTQPNQNLTSRKNIDQLTTKNKIGTRWWTPQQTSIICSSQSFRSHDMGCLCNYLV